MKQDQPDEPAFREFERYLKGVPNDEVIPVLIIAAARSLVIEADGDVGKLLASIHKFSVILAEQARQLFIGEAPDDRNQLPN